MATAMHFPCQKQKRKTLFELCVTLRGKTKFLLKPQFESFCPQPLCVSSGEAGGPVLYITSSQLFTQNILERELTIKTGNFVKAFNKPHKKYQVCKSCRDCLDGRQVERGRGREFIVY